MYGPCGFDPGVGVGFGVGVGSGMGIGSGVGARFGGGFGLGVIVVSVVGVGSGVGVGSVSMFGTVLSPAPDSPSQATSNPVKSDSISKISITFFILSTTVLSRPEKKHLTLKLLEGLRLYVAINMAYFLIE